MSIEYVIVSILIVVQLWLSMYIYRLKNEQVEKLKGEKEELEKQIKLNSSEDEIVRILKIFRHSGFPAVINPKCEPCKDRAERNLWYFKAAMKIKNYDLGLFTDGDYQHIKSEIAVEIPRQRLARDFGLNNEVILDVVPLARALSEHVDHMTWEIFGDAATPH